MSDEFCLNVSNFTDGHHKRKILPILMSGRKVSKAMKNLIMSKEKRLKRKATLFGIQMTGMQISNYCLNFFTDIISEIIS